MTTIERDLLDALLELDQAAAARRGGGTGPALGPILERVDRLGALLPPDAAPDLRHYVQRKSYEKARLFLLGGAQEG